MQPGIGQFFKPVSIFLKYNLLYRTYELPVYGGTPYEKDVMLEATASRRCKKTKPHFYIVTNDVKEKKANGSFFVFSVLPSSWWCFSADAAGPTAAKADC